MCAVEKIPAFTGFTLLISTSTAAASQGQVKPQNIALKTGKVVLFRPGLEYLSR